MKCSYAIALTTPEILREIGKSSIYNSIFHKKYALKITLVK